MSCVRPGLLFLIGLLALGQTDDLSARLRRVLTDPADRDRAALQLRKRDFLSLERMLEEKASADSSARVELLSLEGGVAFMAGDKADALIHFRKAAELGVLQDRDAFTEAMALVALGENRQAAAVLSGLAQQNPTQSIYIYWLGRLDYDLRLYPEAIGKLQKATQLDPNSARAWNALGLAFDMEGTNDGAYGAFQKAVDLNRRLSHPSAWPPHDLGFWYLRMNEFDKAERAFCESLQYDPSFAQAHYHLARTLERQGREQQAIAEYTAAIRTDESSEDACYSLATLYRKLNRSEEANSMFVEYRKRKEHNQKAMLPARLDQQ